MKITVTENLFIDSFRRSESYREHFSYEGLQALFAFLEECDAGCDIESELDVVAIACDFYEWESFEQFADQHSFREWDSLDDVKDYTTVIEIPGTDRFIAQAR
jgi:hypothetical protein